LEERANSHAQDSPNGPEIAERTDEEPDGSEHGGDTNPDGEVLLELLLLLETLADLIAIGVRLVGGGEMIAHETTPFSGCGLFLATNPLNLGIDVGLGNLTRGWSVGT